MKKRNRVADLALCASVLVVSACDQQKKAPELTPEMAQGKAIWEANCRVCHGPGLAGAPVFANANDWAPRIAKGLDVLIMHAQNGFAGPEGHEMPARGGNDKLTDADIASAVTYMVESSR